MGARVLGTARLARRELLGVKVEGRRHGPGGEDGVSIGAGGSVHLGRVEGAGVGAGKRGGAHFVLMVIVG